MEKLVTKCPNCGDFVEIISKNCGIFRHGAFKDSLLQINPHLPEKECENLIKENKIYGCGKPFQLTNENEAVKCGYI